MSVPTHRGRFAPSPTGPLHFGSLVAAAGSYLFARSARGSWHVRIDDVDQTREVPGAADDILRTLESFGFEWAGAVVRQSTRTGRYEEALDQLRRTGAVFDCTCSRRELALVSSPPADGEEARYPGFCRTGPRAPERSSAVRFRVERGLVCFEDLIQGAIRTDVAADAGDFVVRRRDGLFAYQLACAVDDAEQGFTHVVRGADLLGSTARQILLHRALGWDSPHYGHLPLAIDAQGRKLSKTSQAPAMAVANKVPALWHVLRFLRQGPPVELRKGSTADLWVWAISNFDPHPLVGLTHDQVSGEPRCY